MPVVFVHGITVRRAGYDRLLEQVADKLAGRIAKDVFGCYWGDLGSSLQFGGASIPGFVRGTRSIGQQPASPAAGVDPTELAALLLEDPFLELVALRDEQPFDPGGAGFTPVPLEVAQRNQVLFARRAPIAASLQGNPALKSATVRSLPANAVQQLVERAFEEAGRAERRLTVAALIDPLTRCLTAGLYLSVIPTGDALQGEFNWTSVETLVQQTLEVELGGQRGWLGDRLVGAGLSAATFALRHGVRRRMMEALSLFVGDVLIYLANRAVILQRLEDAVVQATADRRDPLWLVGHSLGGVICLDYATDTQRRVERLVTVGSQPGLLGEWGVLRLNAQAHGDGEGTPRLPLPSSLEGGRWLNVYDQNDVLSFLAEPVFTGVVDIPVDTHAPFPVAHSAYWNCAEVYSRLVS